MLGVVLYVVSHDLPKCSESLGIEAVLSWDVTLISLFTFSKHVTLITFVLSCDLLFQCWLTASLMIRIISRLFHFAFIKQNVSRV